MSRMSMEAVFPAIGGIGIFVTVMQPFVVSGIEGKRVGAAVPAPGGTGGATVGAGRRDRKLMARSPSARAVRAMTTFRSQKTTICSRGCVTGARPVGGAREGADCTLQ